MSEGPRRRRWKGVLGSGGGQMREEREGYWRWWWWEVDEGGGRSIDGSGAWLWVVFVVLVVVLAVDLPRSPLQSMLFLVRKETGAQADPHDGSRKVGADPVTLLLWSARFSFIAPWQSLGHQRCSSALPDNTAPVVKVVGSVSRNKLFFVAFQYRTYIKQKSKYYMHL